jgi:hypothetical protein
MTDNADFIDRREHTRFPCKPPLRASFDCQEGCLSADVEDISSAGARLRIPYSNQRIPFLLQGEFDYTFHSDNGQSLYRGKTAWVQRVDAFFVWGIEFINSQKNNDLGVQIGNFETGAQAM